MSKQVFQTPTAQQVDDHLTRHEPRGPSRLLAWLPLTALAVALALSFVIRHPVMLMLPWLALAGTVGFMSLRVRSLRHVEGQVIQAQELAMLRHHAPALQLTWQLIPSACRWPVTHGRLVAFMGHCLDQLKAYDAAIVTYDYLIDQLPRHHPGAVQLLIQRAIAQLQTDQLADADDTIRGLRGMTEAIRHTATGAAYRLAQLLQLVRTNHFAEAAETSASLLEDLRPLGVEAAYGHALMALSYHHLTDPDARSRADLWWSRATLLMPAPALVDRFAELNAIFQAAGAAGARSRGGGSHE